MTSEPITHVAGCLCEGCARARAERRVTPNPVQPLRPTTPSVKPLRPQPWESKRAPEWPEIRFGGCPNAGQMCFCTGECMKPQGSDSLGRPETITRMFDGTVSLAPEAPEGA